MSYPFGYFDHCQFRIIYYIFFFPFRIHLATLTIGMVTKNYYIFFFHFVSIWLLWPLACWQKYIIYFFFYVSIWLLWPLAWWQKYIIYFFLIFVGDNRVWCFWKWCTSAEQLARNCWKCWCQEAGSWYRKLMIWCGHGLSLGRVWTIFGL
jgi:hypothetical protein